MSEQDADNVQHPVTGWDIVHWFITRVLPLVMLIVAILKVLGL